MKWLIFAIFVWLAWRLLRRRREPAAGERSSPSGILDDAERMVRCAHCGVNFPENESVIDSGRLFCSEAHRRIGAPS